MGGTGCPHGGLQGLKQEAALYRQWHSGSDEVSFRP
jgi:hypothetical protein